MAKFIHVDFLLDLTSYPISRVKENQWFSDQFFTSYTFPFDVDLDDDTNRDFGLIMDYTIDAALTFFEGYFFDEGTFYKAELEILEVQGTKASVEISYGFDELPNFEKKLSELPLQVLRLNESLFEHAEDIIDKTWPAVNYNFVQVHTDSFDSGDERWNGFEGIINNRKDGDFLENEFDDIENVVYNRNIMIPMPYFMHVLKTGFANAGFELKGNILTDPEVLKMCFFKETEEYISARIEGAELVGDTSQYMSLFNKTYNFGLWGLRSLSTELGNYRFEHTFPQRGRYKVAGNVYLRRADSDAGLRIDFRNDTIYYVYNELIRAEGGVIEAVRTVDLFVDVTNVNQKLVIVSEQIPYGRPIDVRVDDSPLVDLTITPLAIFDVGGDLVPPVVTSQKVDLTKCVPDITFGDFVKAIKNWRNMELRVSGNQIYIDYIEPQLNISNAIDLTEFEIEQPRRRFKQGDSFLLKYRDVDDENYGKQELFVNLNGAFTNNFSKKNTTNPIEIDAIVLPNIFRNGVSTALAVDKGDSAICAVLYEGATGINNVAENTDSLRLSRIYANFYAKWLRFRIRSQAFDATLQIDSDTNFNLAIDDKVFMYKNYHLIRTLNKTNVPGKNIIEIEMELETLK